MQAKSLISSGVIIDVLHPREPVWRRYPVGSYVLAIAALFGALTAIRDYFGVLFAEPSVGFSYLSPGRLDVVEGAPISVSLAAVSEIRLGQSQAKIESAVMQPEPGVVGAQTLVLEANPQVLSGLAPGQTQTISIDGTAPTLVELRRPAIYKISVEATVRAGIFRFPSHKSVVTRTVWVWPPSPRTFLRQGSKKPSGTCEYDGNIYTSGSAPQGTMVKVEILLTSQQPRGVLPRMIVSPPPGVDLSPGFGVLKTIRKSEFKSPAISGFQSLPYQVYLEFDNQTAENECHNWLSNLDASADWTKSDIQR